MFNQKVVQSEGDVEQTLKEALSLHQQGRLVDALSVYEQCYQRAPKNPDVLHLYGVACQQRGWPAKAIDLIQKAILINPAPPQFHANLGRALYEQGRIRDSYDAFLRALRADPHNADTLVEMGKTCIEYPRFDEGVAYFERAKQLAPNNPMLYGHLGLLFLKAREHGRAVEAFAKSLELDPTNAKIHTNIAHSLIEVGRYEEAEAHLNKSLELDPHNAQSYHHLGVVFTYMGDKETGRTFFKKALEYDPRHTRAMQSYAYTLKPEEYGDIIERMEGMLESITSDDDDVYQLHYAIAHCYLKKKQMRKAAEHWLTGARIKRRNVNYDVAADEHFLDEIRTTFTPELMARLSGKGSDSTAPIFIVGMPRSGTTLTEQILASHPDVVGAGELNYVGQLFLQTNPLGKGGKYPAYIPDCPPQLFGDMAQNYLERAQMHNPDGLAHFVDKMPSNLLFVGVIKLMFPHAKIIHCVRNPVSTCFSCLQQAFSRGQHFSYDLKDLGRYYNAYTRLADHWHALFPGDIYTAVYEDMVQNQEEQSRKLIEFAGLDWHDACLDFHETGRAVRTASHAQVRRPMYKSSLESWREVEDMLAPLIEVLKEDGHIKD